MDNGIILGGSLITSDHFIIVMQLSETAHSLDHRSVEQWFLRHLEEHFDHPLSYVATDPTSRTWKTRFHYDKDKTQLHAVLHFETEQANAWHPSGLFLVRGIMPKDLAAHMSFPPEVTHIGISPVSEKQARLHTYVHRGRAYKHFLKQAACVPRLWPCGSVALWPCGPVAL